MNAGWQRGVPVRERLARLRVSLGFLSAIAALYLATPTAGSLVAGGAIAAVGEMLRVWAAGHLRKSSEVTTSGPYRWFAHPLYVGSSIMGVGLAIAAASVPVAVLVVTYLAVTITAAVRSEEAFLRQRFGTRYDRYRQTGVVDQTTRFSAARALANREHRAVTGLIVAVLLLAAKAAFR